MAIDPAPGRVLQLAVVFAIGLLFIGLAVLLASAYRATTRAHGD